MVQAKITSYQPRFLPKYIELNRDWIEHYFKMEPNDVEQLENSREQVLDRGGEIFFVVENDEAVGTCAMIPHGERCYELAKMAVARSTRGKGYGDLLMRKAIEWAREKGAEKVMLLSNTVLSPAITLYKKHGFTTVNLGAHPDYERCNIEMELKF